MNKRDDHQTIAFDTVFMLLLLMAALKTVEAQPNAPATCVRVWQLDESADLLQACQEPSSAVNVIVENNNIINVFGGGGQIEIIEGRDAVTESAVTTLLEQYPQQSILALVVESNQAGTIDIQSQNAGSNPDCRDNTSDNNLVTVGGTNILQNLGVMNAYANGGVVFVALMRGSGGTVNINRRKRQRQRRLRAGASQRQMAAEELPGLQRGEDEPAIIETPKTTARTTIKKNESIPTRPAPAALAAAKRDLQQCDLTPGFQSICWWMYLLAQSGRQDGTGTCNTEYGCGPNPCPPQDGAAAPTPRPPTKPKPPTGGGGGGSSCGLDLECCVGCVKRYCDCGNHVVCNSKCYWEVAKTHCRADSLRRVRSETKAEFRARVRATKQRFKRHLEHRFGKYCKPYVGESLRKRKHCK